MPPRVPRSTPRGTPRASSSTEPSTSQRHTEIPKDDLTNLVNNTVYYILVADQHKKAIKRKDIQDLVLKHHSRSLKEVLKEVRLKLSDVFGYKLLDLGDRQKSFILVSELSLSEVTKYLKRTDADNAKIGLITLLLALILVNNGTVTEEKLWGMLSLFGLRPDVEDPVFGDVRKLITTDLVKEAYLEYTAVPDAEPPANQFCWGVRAIHETSEKTISGFVCKILGNDAQSEQWSAMYKDIMRRRQEEQ